MPVYAISLVIVKTELSAAAELLALVLLRAQAKDAVLLLQWLRMTRQRGSAHGSRVLGDATISR